MKVILCLTLALCFTYSQVFPSETQGLKFRGGPKTICKAYFICESGFHLNLKSKPDFEDENHVTIYDDFLLPLDLGYMRNISKYIAVGASGHLSFDGNFTRYGLRPRIQYWLKTNLAVNISPGLYWFSNESYKQVSPGKILGLSVVFAEIIALDFIYDSYKLNSKIVEDLNLNREGYYLGISGRSESAVIVPVIALGFAAFLQGLNNN
ncbi:MAG: hypothetical protein DWP97_04345 [Calditrichaeota bacterium]|nr:MAG: hypothetical protein DWP97_04345 [Calditrichota bacterium]